MVKLTPLSHQFLIQRNVTTIPYWQILTRYRNSFDPTFRGWAWPESMAFSTGDAAHKTPRWAGTVSEVSSPAKEVAQGAMVKTWNIPWIYIYMYIYMGLWMLIPSIAWHFIGVVLSHHHMIWDGDGTSVNTGIYQLQKAKKDCGWCETIQHDLPFDIVSHWHEWTFIPPMVLAGGWFMALFYSH